MTGKSEIKRRKAKLGKEEKTREGMEVCRGVKVGRKWRK